MISQYVNLDERGVSPVIGVILMVAITVILAAVIGSFVLGIGGDIEAAPQASLSMQDTSGNATVTVSHGGGDTLSLSNFHYTVDGSNAIQFSGNASKSGDFGPGQSVELWNQDPTTAFSTGQKTVRIIHSPSGQLVAESTVQVTPS